MIGDPAADDTSSRYDYQVLVIFDRHRDYLDTVINVKARKYSIDRDDLRQEFLLRLLLPHDLDVQRNGVRSWLAQKVEWTACDMWRSWARRLEIAVDPFDEDVLPTNVNRLGVPAAGEPSTLNLKTFVSHGCTANEAQTLMFLVTGLDGSLADWASAVGRSHAQVRKEKSRGLQRIEQVLDLTAEETAAMRALSQYSKRTTAAAVLGMSVDELSAVLDRARAKIEHFFDGLPAEPESVDQHVWQQLCHWGIADVEQVPLLLAKIHACVSYYEDPAKPALYRPLNRVPCNRLQLILDGSDDVPPGLDRKTWRENGARVWRHVLDSMREVVPSLARPGTQNAAGATTALRQLYMNLRAVDLQMKLALHRRSEASSPVTPKIEYNEGPQPSPRRHQDRAEWSSPARSAATPPENSGQDLGEPCRCRYRSVPPSPLRYSNGPMR